ncbi:hypothetical protein FISHEDRAFT_24688, partial [Fistulina hepatica ATCC 64428]
ILHIADSIQAIGPVWTYWAFVMEHYCGHLGHAINSHRYPYADLDNWVLNAARLSQVQILYG